SLNVPQSFFIFGRDVSQIPCFRNSFLYGISGGMGIGVLTFLGTSRPHLATHVGFGSFFCGTIVYWMACRLVLGNKLFSFGTIICYFVIVYRYQWSLRRFEQQQLREAMRRQAQYEGTDVERELDLKTA
ncbi:hypothetical protein KR215_001717, partial [Drosophila sulfurigaster]